MAVKMIPKTVAGKEVGGWWEAEEGAHLGLFCPNTIEARDRSTGPLGTMPVLFS